MAILDNILQSQNQNHHHKDPEYADENETVFFNIIHFLFLSIYELAITIHPGQTIFKSIQVLYNLFVPFDQPLNHFTSRKYLLY